MTLLNFVRASRAELTFDSAALRLVYWTDVAREDSPHTLAGYLANRAPLFYREPERIAAQLSEGFFISPFADTLLRLPTAESFQESHFGEIIAALFAEEVLGLTRIYSKLSFLSAENANAYKMDLVMADLSGDHVEFVWGEVKSSPKCPTTHNPPYHTTSCYPALFDSLREYSDRDREFDLACVRDNLDRLPADQRDRIRNALKPFARPLVRYAAIAVIDSGTYDQAETHVLHTRTSSKEFNVDIVGIEALPSVIGTCWSFLEGVRAASQRIR